MDLNNYVVLVSLKAFSHWNYVIRLNPNYFPARRQLKVGFDSALKGLEEDSGKTYKRLLLKADRQGCLICRSKIDVANSMGDHIIPRSMGGETTHNNLLPICRQCNSLKGTMHFFDFWFFKLRKKLTEIDKDALVLIVRAYWRYYKSKGLLFKKPCPSLLKAFKEAGYVLSVDPGLAKIWESNVKKLIEESRFRQAEELVEKKR